MKIPEGYTEKEIIDIMYSVARRIAPIFKFGYNEIEDMVQEAVMEAIIAIEDYETSKGTLNNFIWTHMHNRLYNLKRNKYERPDNPCMSCPLNAYDPDCKNSNDRCTAFVKRDECKLYRKWYNRNSRKKNLISPIGFDGLDSIERSLQTNRSIIDSVYGAQIINYIDNNIPMEFRANWIKLKNDAHLKKTEKELLISKIREMLDLIGFSYEK